MCSGIFDEKSGEIERSYCGNSDLFYHGLYVEVEEMPEEYYRQQAELFYMHFGKK